MLILHKTYIVIRITEWYTVDLVYMAPVDSNITHSVNL